LEPLQKDAENMLTEMDTTKEKMENLRLEAKEMMKEHITTHNVESIAEKSTQVQPKIEGVTGKFQELAKLVCDANIA